MWGSWEELIILILQLLNQRFSEIKWFAIDNTFHVQGFWYLICCLRSFMIIFSSLKDMIWEWYKLCQSGLAIEFIPDGSNEEMLREETNNKRVGSSRIINKRWGSIQRIQLWEDITTSGAEGTREGNGVKSPGRAEGAGEAVQQELNQGGAYLLWEKQLHGSRGETKKKHPYLYFFLCIHVLPGPPLAEPK